MKKISKIIIAVVFSLLFITAIFSGDDTAGNNSNDNDNKQDETVKVLVPDFSTFTKDEASSWCIENDVKCSLESEYSDTVENGNFISQSITSNQEINQKESIKILYSLGVEPSEEFKNALKKAETYSDVMHMSKASIYDQLVSEYGENFEEDAAQYAIDNLEADWNYNALKSAENYSKTMHMSKAAIYDQLISEYGEQFTEEEAQYAIDNIVADWNSNALFKAKSYRDDLNMSTNAVYDQLISEYGEQFTEEEAQYAIDNLDK